MDAIFKRLYSINTVAKDKYRHRHYFPIGTKEPYSSYQYQLQESDLVFLKMDTLSYNDATSFCIVGQSGTLKTTLIKSIVYYNSLIPNTKIAVIDLKGDTRDWQITNDYAENEGSLYPDESANLNILCGCPNFALRGMPLRDVKNIIKMNLDPKHLAHINTLEGLDISKIGRQFLFRELLKNKKPLEIINKIEELRKKGKMVRQTYENVSLILENLINVGFLAETDYININQIWDNNLSFAIGFNNKEIPFLSVYVDKILSIIFDRANSKKGENERYLIVVDDCKKAFGLSPERYPSVLTGIDSVTQWRRLGINMIFSMQNPTMINDEILGDIKHWFIYQCPNISELAKFLPNRNILNIAKNLVFIPEKHISQCLHIFPDRQKYELFYTLNSPISNNLI